VQEERTILGRLGSSHEIAAAAAFLLSEDASYVTAETLVVAGGMSSKL
jgi:dehydrogenase/reductase SDR family member 4